MSDENATSYPERSAERSTSAMTKEGAAETGKPRRARWPWVLLIIVLLLAVLAVAAEVIARAILPGVVRGIVVEQLKLPADQQLEVDASGILLPQLIGGRLDQLHLSTDSIAIGGVSGAVDLTVDGVLLSGAGLADALGTVSIGTDEFAALLATSDLPSEDVAFAEPDITLSGSFSTFGAEMPVVVTVAPSVDAGALVLEPLSQQVDGTTMETQEFSERFGSAGEQLTQTQRICIADRFPAGVTVTDFAIAGDQAVVHLQVDGAIATDPALQASGACD